MRGKWIVLVLSCLVLVNVVACSQVKGVFQIEPTPTFTPTRTPHPTFTPTATYTPRPPATSTPTETLVPPANTPTLVPPTATLVPPTPTHRPPTATPTQKPPTPTTGPPYQFVSSYVGFLPNCGVTFIEGKVYDAFGQQLGGVRVKVWTAGWEITRETPTDPGKGAGYYDVILSTTGPRAGTWFIAIIDDGGSLISEVVQVETDLEDCTPHGRGRQWVTVDFKKN